MPQNIIIKMKENRKEDSEKWARIAPFQRIFGVRLSFWNSAAYLFYKTTAVMLQIHEEEQLKKTIF